MRSNVSHSSLVALLRDWNFEDTDSAQPDSTERLSLWLKPRDAISLHAVHLSIQAAGLVSAPHRRKEPLVALDAEFRRMHSELLISLALSKTTLTSGSLAKNHALQVDAIDDAEPEFSLYRQHHLEQQRRMDERIGQFGRRCRQVLAQSSIHHRQLVELDTTMKHIFGEHERALLSKLPALLERRFNELKSMHLNACTDAQDVVLVQSKPNGWIETFEKNYQEALRAELNLRLESVAGLIEAYCNEA